MITKAPMRTLFLLLFAFLLTAYSQAQCDGNILIDSQAQLDKFTCTTFKGNLRISGDDIKDLSPLKNLVEVSGSLIINLNPSLEILQGIEQLSSVGGSFIIADNTNLQIVSKSPLSLQEVGDELVFTDCPKLVIQDEFANLQFIKTSLSFTNIASVQGFDAIAECPIISFAKLQQSTLEGFRKILQIRSLIIQDCSNLQEVNAFSGLGEVSNYDGGGSTTLLISGNSSLKSLVGLENIESVFNLTITNNNILSNCCDILPAMLSAKGSVTISGNSLGCSSQKEINAGPVLSNCPSNQTVSTSPSECNVSFSLTQPIPSDNCDLSTTNIRLTLDDGSVPVSQSISPGSTGNYSLQQGSNIFLFSANDGAGNQSTCQATITVIDDVKPALSNCPSNMTINTDSNIQCSGSFTYNTPNASDNCSLKSLNERFLSPGGSEISNVEVNPGQSFTKTFSLGTSTLEYTASDEEGNLSECSVLITVEDNKAPVLSGIPSDVTIGCDDNFPSIPSPTASDLCDGNLTGSIMVSSSNQSGTCGIGQIADEQEYTWTVTDNAGNSTSESWKVTVISDFDFDLGEDLSLCGESAVVIDAGNIGDSYIWSTGSTSSSISVSTTGTYSVTVTTSNGCCFSDEVEVAIGENPTVSASGGTLSCSAGSITLSGSSTTAGVNYSWSGPGGFTSNQASPSVSSIGTYTLVVTTSNGCTASTQVEVLADTDVPDVSASGGELSCSILETVITASSNTSGVSYSWSGPGGFSSSQQSPTVSLAGQYTVTVTADNGCTASSSVTVSSDNEGPSLSLSSGILNCFNLVTRLEVVGNAISYAWSGPNGFSSSDKEPEVEEVGTYTLISTAGNGCASSDNIEVGGDYEEPNVSASGGMISCSDNETMIMGSTTTPNATASWSGPNGFTSDVLNPFISQPGTYTLTITGSNGCTASADVEVMGDNEIPNITASGGTIDCLNETVTIVGTVDDPEASTSWSGPNGFTTTSLTSEVDIPGTYTFTVTTPGGCQSFAAVEVILNNSEPTFSIGEGFIDCENGVRDFVLITNTDEASFSWKGPDGFESTDKEPTYNKAGTYGVTITGDNGCISSGAIVVEHDVDYEFEISTNNGVTEIDIQGGTPPFSFVWNGNVEGASISDLGLGEFFVRITDGLGCEATEFFEITSSVYDLNELEGALIYPNPASEILNIELPDFLRNVRLNVLDQNGSLILSEKYSPELNVSHLLPGVYFLRVNDAEASYFYKFFKL